MKTQIEKEQYIAQAKIDRDDYFLAVVLDNYQKSVAIENKYELYGYPPELVSVGLNAVARGIDAHQAIIDYINDEEYTPE